MVINATVLLALLGAGEALFFDYFPFVAAWFDKLEQNQKQLLTLALAMALGVGVFGASCLGWLVTSLVCDAKTATGLAYDVIVAVATMYGFHQATKPTASLKARLHISK